MVTRKTTKAALVIVLFFNAVACQAHLPGPPLGPHSPKDIPLRVMLPPPEVVKVQQVPEQPRKGAVWVDGYWRWTSAGWQWQAGSWQLVPAGAWYAQPELLRIPVPVYERSERGKREKLKGYGMTLLFLPGHWHDASGKTVEAIPAGKTAAGTKQTRAPR